MAQSNWWKKRVQHLVYVFKFIKKINSEKLFFSQHWPHPLKVKISVFFPTFSSPFLWGFSPFWLSASHFFVFSFPFPFFLYTAAHPLTPYSLRTCYVPSTVKTDDMRLSRAGLARNGVTNRVWQCSLHLCESLIFERVKTPWHCFIYHNGICMWSVECANKDRTLKTREGWWTAAAPWCCLWFACFNLSCSTLTWHWRPLSLPGHQKFSWCSWWPVCQWHSA